MAHALAARNGRGFVKRAADAATRGCCASERAGRCAGGVTALRAAEGPGFTVTEAWYPPGGAGSSQGRASASLCLTVAGAYWERRAGANLLCDAPTLMYHPPADRRTTVISDDGSRCLELQLDPRMIRSLPRDTAELLDRGAARRSMPTSPIFRLRAALWREDDLAPLEVEETLCTLLSDLAARAGLEIGGAAPPWLERVRARLHDEFTTRVTLADLALTAGVHRVHLARTFRSHYRCTIGEYVRQRRVEFACRALMGGDVPLSIIALAAGFSDQSHLTNTFRRLVGTTPGAFRQAFGTR